MKKSEIIHRQQKVWQYHIQGYNQQQIATKLKVAAKTISRDFEELKKDSIDWYNNIPKGELYVNHKMSIDSTNRVISELWKLYRTSKNEGKKIQALNSIAARSKSIAGTMTDSLMYKELEYLQQGIGSKTVSESINMLWKAKEKLAEMDEFKSKCTCGAALALP